MKLSISTLLFIFAVSVATAGEFGRASIDDKAMVEKKLDSSDESGARNAGEFDEPALSSRRVGGRGAKNREDFGPTSNGPVLVNPTFSAVETNGAVNPWDSAQRPATSMAELPQTGVRYRSLYQPSAVNGAASQTVEMLDQMRGDVRLLVGEDAYAQVTVAYFDFKKIDQWISSTINEYALVAGGEILNVDTMRGLDDQLVAHLIGANGNGVTAGGLAARGQIDLPADDNKASDGNWQRASFDYNFEEHSKFFRIFKYFTFLNCLYFFLILTSTYAVLKGFRFVIRGRRSSK